MGPMRAMWVMLALLPGIASCERSDDVGTDSHADALAPTSSATPTSPAAPTLKPLPAPDDRGTLPASEVAAIMRLGATGAGPPPDHDQHHGSAPTLSTPSEADARALDVELDAARSSIGRLDTIEEAAALGYVLATAPSPGIGTHWVRWSQIEQPFDPGLPAMLMFDHERSPPALAGYSYALQSAEEPIGFTGDSDVWHRHTGLCVAATGWVVRERAPGPGGCDGSYIAGADFWMLHTWIVPGWENRDGLFAPMNPKLCPSESGTPEYRRCPDAMSL